VYLAYVFALNIYFFNKTAIAYMHFYAQIKNLKTLLLLPTCIYITSNLNKNVLIVNVFNFHIFLQILQIFSALNSLLLVVRSIELQSDAKCILEVRHLM